MARDGLSLARDGLSFLQCEQTYSESFLCFARTEIMGPCWFPIMFVYVKSTALMLMTSLKNRRDQGFAGLEDTKEPRKWRGGFVLPQLGGCI